MNTMQDLREMIPDAEAVLEEEWGAVAPDPPPGDDGLPVSQDISLVHKVGRQQDHLQIIGEYKVAHWYSAPDCGGFDSGNGSIIRQPSLIIQAMVYSLILR